MVLKGKYLKSNLILYLVEKERKRMIRLKLNSNSFF